MFPDMSYGDAIQFAGAVSLIVAVIVVPVCLFLGVSAKEVVISFFIVAAPMLLAIGFVGISPYLERNQPQGDSQPKTHEIIIPEYEPLPLLEPKL